MTCCRQTVRGFYLRIAAVFAVFWLAGCRVDASASDEREHELVVFAAASLRETFEELGVAFKRSHADLTLTFNFAGTQELRTQLTHGAQADVFASANRKHMAELERSGQVTQPIVFARNEPVVIVSLESAAVVHALADLPQLDRIVIGTPEVPIGGYTLEILDRASLQLGADFRAQVEKKVVSRELNVRQVLSKVSLGEADAGIVYRTDAYSPGAKVHVVDLPPEINVVADYPIAVLLDAPHPKLARKWLEFIRSQEAIKILTRHGFRPASPGGH